MEFWKIINLLVKTSNQPSKFTTKNWVEINDDARGMWIQNSQIKFKISMLKSILCYYGDTYILVSRTIIFSGTGADNNAKRLDKRNKRVIFKNYAPLTECINEINNSQIDDAKDLDVVIPMYNFVEYSDNYSRTSGVLWQ